MHGTTTWTHPRCGVRCATQHQKSSDESLGFPTLQRTTGHQLRIIRFSWDCVLHRMPFPLVHIFFCTSTNTTSQTHIVRHLICYLMRTRRLLCCQEPRYSITRVSCSPDEGTRDDRKRLGCPRVVSPPVLVLLIQEFVSCSRTRQGPVRSLFCAERPPLRKIGL